MSSSPYPIRSGQTNVQIIRRPRCPSCDTLNVECTNSRPGEGATITRYYRCRECKDVITQKSTTFKVVVH